MSQNNLQWFVLKDEASKVYTNWSDERPRDASELVAKADPALNQDHTDYA